MKPVLPESRQIILNGALVALVWSALNALSLGWEIHVKRQQSFELARHEAAAYIRRDIDFRNWAASHGGVYVPPSASTPPNPYLEDFPERDIVSTTGKRLTLMNPAYMLREVQSHAANSWGKGHLTSLKLLNPLNKPDEWERDALHRLERGEKEVVSLIGEGADAQLRMMQPLHIEKGCLTCHRKQGYKEGDLRGGIDVTLNMAPFLASANDTGMKSAFNHGLIWIIGLTSIGFLTRRTQKREIERLLMQQALLDSEERFRAITSSAKDAIIMMNDQGLVVYWNPAAEKLFGYPGEAALGQVLHDLIMPKCFAEDFSKGFQKYLDNGMGPVVNHTLELTARRQDGTEFPVELSVSTTVLESRRHAIGIVRDISVRKQAEAALRASKEQLDEAQRIAHLGRYTYDLQTDRWTSSDILDDIFGINGDYPRDSRHWLELVAEESRPEMRAYLDMIVEQRLPFNREYPIVRSHDSQERWVHGKGELRLDESGIPLALVGTITDITERKQAEQEILRYRDQLEEVVKARTQALSLALEQLWDIEQRQGLMLDHLPVGVVLSSGIEQKILYHNPRFTEMLGYTIKDIPDVAQLWPAAFPDPEYRESIISEWNRRMAAAIEHKAEIEPMEFAIATKQGMAKHIRVHAVVIGDLNFVTVIDLTKLKQAEETLRISLQREQLLFESSRDALMLLAPPSWKFTSANRATLQLFGASSVAEFTVLGPWDVSPQRQPDGRLSNEKAPEMIATAMREGVHFFEWEHRRLDGRPFAADVLLTRMEVGGEVFLQGTVRDISERKRAENELRQLNESLEQRVAEAVTRNMEHERLLIQQSRLAAMGEMVHNIAHQWRQPLTTVDLILQNIVLDYDENLLTSASLHEYAGNGKSLIQKMTATIDDFRDFFIPQREKVEFSLHQALRSALNIVNASFFNHGIVIEHGGGEDARVKGFPNEYAQVLLNLLANAKEAILEQRVHGGVIEISLGQDANKAWVTVKDNGGGIPEDILAKIFDPYFTTKDKGTGIGLYMSKMIMAHMDGTIEARNRDGGMEFSAVMPKTRS